MTTLNTPQDDLAINTIRFLAVDAVQQANSGHPGMPMGAAAMAYALWTGHLKHNPHNPAWHDRDRFVLSAGHGSMLLYGLLHLTGYDLTIDDLKNFRQWGSKTPGHPEYGETPGVETTAGPLGQGFANGVGLAIAEAHLAARFNRPDYPVVNHYTYGIVSDGDLMEGISHEAASLAGHLQLGKLIYLYDDNHISIEGSTDLAFTEDRLKRFEAYGWQVLQVVDGNNLEAINKAIRMAREETGKPSMIAVRTNIGFGSPNRQDTAKAHGEPLGADEIKATKENLGWPLEPVFHVPAEALSCFRKAVDKGADDETAWQKLMTGYRNAFPELAAELEQRLNGELPADWDLDLPVYAADAKGKATRAASGAALNAIAPRVKSLMGGSADLAPSNKSMIDREDAFQPGNYAGRNIHFGVREHGMGAVMNGMALHGGFIPYGATFLIFSDYLRPAIRLAALMRLKTIYIFTHDSIGVGEDGPTHQPIEQLASLRAMPNLAVIRPADANETAIAWKMAISLVNQPVVLALTRQSLPVLDRTSHAAAENLEKGAYVLRDFGNDTPLLILMASGSEVHIALDAAARIAASGVPARVVSMPCWELFDRQPEEYRNSVLPPAITARIAIEAGSPFGWERYTGTTGRIIALDHFGASAPMKELYNRFGLTADHVVEEAGKLI